MTNNNDSDFVFNQSTKSVHSGRNMNEELCKLVVIFAEFAIYNQQLGIMLGNLQNTSQIFQIAGCPILLYHLCLYLITISIFFFSTFFLKLSLYPKKDLKSFQLNWSGRFKEIYVNIRSFFF